MRRIYHSKRVEIIGYLVLFTVLVLVCTTRHAINKWLYYDTCNIYGETFDVVYTWVNGSDEYFQKTVLKYRPVYGNNRYDDKNELKYSLRSLEKYAPWLGHVYIVTNGQIPSWLNLEYEKVSVISHDQLMDDPRILPTFSSPVIEQFLHRIVNLSKRFVYFNDDTFLGSKLYPEDLYSERNGISIKESSSSPLCASFCDWKKLGNGKCDRYCNVEECDFDGDDCIKFTGENFFPNFSRVKARKSKQIFAESLVHTNKVLTLAYGMKKRYYPSHVPLLLDKDIVEGMIQKFQNEFNLTRYERFRTAENIQFPFMYNNYVQSERQNLTIDMIFDKFDTDNSTTWSGSEVRTLITQLYPLPLDSKRINNFGKIINNCDPGFISKINVNNTEDELIYEKYFHWKYPAIHKSVVVNCTAFVKMLLENFGQEKQYKFYKLNDTFYNSFIVIRNNITKFLNDIDQLRKNPKKFVCINDGLKSIPNNSDDKIIRKLLEDFYLVLFPYPSKFELAENNHNRINYFENYLKNDWQKHEVISLITIFIILLLIFFKLKYYIEHKLEQKRISFHKIHKY